MTKLRFSHTQTTYVFIGKELDPPKPGSYDAAKWTPPTHRVFHVSIWNNGCWVIKVNDAQIATGEGARPGRGEALALVNRHCGIYL